MSDKLRCATCEYFISATTLPDSILRLGKCAKRIDDYWPWVHGNYSGAKFCKNYSDKEVKADKERFLADLRKVCVKLPMKRPTMFKYTCPLCCEIRYTAAGQPQECACGALMTQEVSEE